ncbi:internalin [Chlorella sorokiniana]|uniref:Internalin n=1 Tax=Chlorella sorokiniana TaxID=3076 RepID=A0A2P6TU25_CHLSO|nr:internalin [Chlorella sorokiniana]|eukprot:PRW57577.1 internalin [Chlorella sorokiniana]
MALPVATDLSIDDLPDDVLKRVFLLAGTRYGPAIVGVCKRWAWLYWEHSELWRHLTISAEEPDQPSLAAASPSAPLIMFVEHQQAYQQRRLAGWQVAKRAQLQRVGHLVEAATFQDRTELGRGDSRLQISALLPLLSPTLGALSLPWAREEQALLLPRFSQLTSLEIAADGGVSAILPRLGALKRLKLQGGSHGSQLATALQQLSALTSLELEGCFDADVAHLRRLQQLRHLVLRSNNWPPREPTRPPPPAGFASLESYSFVVNRPFGGVQLADFQLTRLRFQPCQDASAEQPVDAASCGRPGCLLIGGLLAGAAWEGDEELLDDDGDSDSDSDSGSEAGAEQPPPPSARQLNSLLEVALPPGAALQQLTLSHCVLQAATLHRLPALASLQYLEVQDCSSRSGSMDGPLQALVQLAPALTSLHFEAPRGRPAGRAQARCCLRSCPAYLLAHPCLRSAVVLNRQLVEWDMEEALRRLPSIAAAAPVLEHLVTDGFAFMPPALATVTSLRSLAFLDQPEFEFNGDTVALALALPHLTSLTLPQLTPFEQQAAYHLRHARPGFSLQVQPKEQTGEQEEGTANPCVIS